MSHYHHESLSSRLGIGTKKCDALARRTVREGMAEERAMSAGKMLHELGVEKPSVLTLG
jgi:hypothetical protein